MNTVLRIILAPTNKGQLLRWSWWYLCLAMGIFSWLEYLSPIGFEVPWSVMGLYYLALQVWEQIYGSHTD